ncbi:MAG TPA: DUF4383 domain-containing protein [Candidatus Dormibacteraeota bacterium]|nr:DUF4383 domain-containing protein [Candidatus Dormibacteraeota bacterium]
MQDRSPAELYALLAGVLLIALGMLGFFYNGTFTSNELVHSDMLGVFRVNGWVNTLNVAAGVVALAARPSARMCAAGLGVVFVALGIWGLMLGEGDSVLGILPLNTADCVLYLAIGVAGLAAASVSPQNATVPA